MREALVVIAAVLVSAGFALVWIPLGVICAGVALGAIAILSE